MKKYISFIAIAAFVAAGVISCGKVEEELINPADEEITDVIEESEPSVSYLTFALSNGESTKAVLGESAGKKFAEWEDGDKIGSITTKSNGFSTVDASSTPVTFNVYSSGGLSEGNTINLWYPYSTTQADATAVALSIPATQNQVGGVFDYSAMPMVAEQITVTAGMVSATNNTPVDVVGFYNLGSLIDFKIFASSSYTTEKVLSVTFNASAAIAGDFTKNLTAVDASNESTLAISGYTATSVTTNVMPFSTVGTSKETPLDVYMVVAPGTYTGTVVVVTDAATYTWTISSGKEFNRSSVKPLGLQLDKASATRVAHVKGCFSWDLSKVSWDSLDDDNATWSHGILTLDAEKGSGTKLTNYTPPTNSSTRFYKNNNLYFTVGSLQIEKVEFTATTDSYATAMASSDWTNATGSASGTTATITPIDGSDDFMATIGAATGNTKITVYYDNNTYTISGASSPVAGGTFTIKKGASDVTSAKVNTTITLASDANDGYTFSSWTVKDAENNDIPVVSNEFQMPSSNVTVTANFAEESESKTITITTPSNGTVSTSPSGTVAPGTLVTITATPNTGYVVASVSVVDEDSGTVTVTSNQFTMPAKNVTVTVTFARVYSVVFDNTTNQTGISSYTGSFSTISDGITVSCQNFNNNNSGVTYTGSTQGTWTYIQAGAKKAKAADDTKVTTGTITTSSAISAVIRKVVVPITILRGSATGKLYVASNSGFSSDLQTIDLGSLSTGDVVFSIPAPAANRYYKLEFVCSNTTTTNGVVKISEIQYSTID